MALQQSSFLGERAVVAARPPGRARPPARLRTVCRLTDRGRSVAAESIQVRSPLGEGSYGQVFEGWLEAPDGRQQVVLKRVKTKVEGAAEMGMMEHLLNVYASKTARGSVADFVGYAQVRPEEATRNLTEGLWLLWKYEGSRTLAHYLRRRDCVQRLAADVGVAEAAALPTVMQHIFEGLAGLHAAGLVHRDVKPLNIIFSEAERRFKLIDLGACADLRTGTNYVPDESILDPTYCPPEQYCMPTDSPHLAKQFRPLAVAMSPVLWSRFKPDRFDSYSAGLVLLQLGLPKLRNAAGIRQFNEQFRRAGWDLGAWREAERPPTRETALLDAEGGAGWELAGALLRPRDIRVDERGGVTFVSRGGAIRMPVKAALRHRFFKPARAAQTTRRRQGSGSTRQAAGSSGTAVAPARQATRAAGGLLSGALNAWGAASERLRELEYKLSRQERAVAAQTGKVEVLKADVAEGRADEEALRRQETLLGRMTGRLTGLRTELGSTAEGARSVLQGFLPGQPGGKLSNQARAVATQQVKVEVLRAEFATGQVKREVLEREEGLLRKMTRRLGTLQEEFNAAAAIFQPRPPPAAAAAEPLPPPLQRSQGGSSFLKSLLGGNRSEGGSQAERRSSEDTVTFSSRSDGTAYDNTRSDLPPSLAAAGSGSTGTGQQRSKEQQQQQSGGRSAGAAAVTGIYAGLKLTGLALRVATDMAAAMSRDANAAFVAGEADRSAKRKLRQARAAFLDLLRSTEPPVRADSRWADVRRALAKDARFAGLEEAQRAALFREYVAELARVQQSRLQLSEDTFRELLAEVGLERGSTLARVEAALAGDARFEALPAGLDRAGLFTASMVQARPEFDFCDLLAECDSPMLEPGCTWSQARRQVTGDPRFAALSERRRRAVFRRFVDGLEASAPLPAPGVAAASEDSLSTLNALRTEQERLRREYERMAAELRDVERRLQSSAQPGQAPREAKQMKIKDLNGSLTDLVSQGPPS